jgi:enoyl-CoA hydratase/carnithine racemase
MKGLVPCNAELPVDRSLAMTCEGGTMTLCLRRAARGNALDEGLVGAIQDALDVCAARRDLHTLVLRAEGKHFSTGFDLSDAGRATDAMLLQRFIRLELMLQSLAGVAVRTVAAVQGRAVGAGADLVAACDVRLAVPVATFRFPGAQFGIVLGTRRLAQRIGVEHARRIIACGETLDAQRAHALGLVSEITHDLEAALAALPSIAIDRETSSRVLAATRPATGDVDLADLVRSAARPGLAARLHAYSSRTQPPRAHTAAGAP